MRGIYYAYVIRLATLPGVWQGFLMLASLIALTYFVSIGNVIQNLLNIPTGHIGTFFYNALRNTEAWTLLLIGVIVFLTLSIRISFARKTVPTYTYGRV